MFEQKIVENLSLFLCSYIWVLERYYLLLLRAAGPELPVGEVSLSSERGL